MQDREMMEMALALAHRAADAGEVPVGAVLVRGEEILACARNEREERHDPTAHAEILALREGAKKTGDWNLSDCTLYVTLEPCPMCAGAIVQSHLGRVVFSAFHKEGGACGSRIDLTSLSPGTIFQGGLLHEESAALLRAFFEEKREANNVY